MIERRDGHLKDFCLYSKTSTSRNMLQVICSVLVTIALTVNKLNKVYSLAKVYENSVIIYISSSVTVIPNWYAVIF